MDEAEARKVINDDYNERRAIMDASPIQVSVAGRMMFKRVMVERSLLTVNYISRDSMLLRLLPDLVTESMVLRKQHTFCYSVSFQQRSRERILFIFLPTLKSFQEHSFEM